jgi:hypothetical protein
LTSALLSPQESHLTPAYVAQVITLVVTLACVTLAFVVLVVTLAYVTLAYVILVVTLPYVALVLTPASRRRKPTSRGWRAPRVAGLVGGGRLPETGATTRAWAR